MSIKAKATLLFWPPDRLETGRVASSPDTPKAPILFLYNSEGFPVNVNKLLRELDKHHKLNKATLNE